MELFLRDVEPEHCFYTKDGTVLKNLRDLRDKLFSMDDASFQHHVTQDRNDFVNWVEDSIGDLYLSDQLRTLKSREEMAAAVASRIEKLQERSSSKEAQESAPEAEAPVPEAPIALQPAPDPTPPPVPEYKHVRHGYIDFLEGIALGILVGLIIARLIG